LVQDRTTQPHRFRLQRTAGPYIRVKSAILRTRQERLLYICAFNPVSATPLVFYWLAFRSPRSFAGVD
jgi:hypothetical protein